MYPKPRSPTPQEENVEARTWNRILSHNRLALRNKKRGWEKCLAVVFPEPQVWQSGVLCSLLPPFLSSYSLSLFATVSLSLPNWFARIFCCFCTAYPSQNQAYLPISLLEQSVYSLCQGENESMEWEACDDSKSSALKHWSKYKVVFAWALHRCY